MPNYYCIECGRQIEHLNIKRAAEYCAVTRATVYNWIKRDLVHCLVQPSGRKFICTGSLLVPGAFRLQPSWSEMPGVEPTPHRHAAAATPPAPPLWPR